MATSSSSGISGFGSSFDWRSFVSQMVAVERQPQQRVRAEQSSLNQKSDALASVVTSLSTLQQRAKAVSDANLFNARAVSVTNSTTGLATATASDKALTGSFSIEVVDSGGGIATTGPWRGCSYASAALTTSAAPVTLSTLLSQIDPQAGAQAPGATGSVSINGKAVSLTSSSTLADVITAINASGAGVSARFDTVAGKIVITSTTSSDISALAIVGSEYANLLGLGDLKTPSSGVPLRYMVDGGPLQTSNSPILTQDQTGLVGITVTVAPGKTGTIDLGSSQDTSRIRGAITDLVDAYNKVQSLISSKTAVNTGANGKVTSGVLAFDTVIAETSSKLRRMLTSSQAGAPENLTRLDLLGFTTGSDTNEIKLSDSTKLDSVLKSNPEAVKAFFTTADTGLANLVADYAGKLSNSTSGSLVDLQTRLKKQATNLDTQLAAMERQVLFTQDRLTAGFVSMERVQMKLNQQLQYLQQRFR